MGFERVGAKLYCSPYDLTPKTIYEITFLKILGVNNFFFFFFFFFIALYSQHTLYRVHCIVYKFHTVFPISKCSFPKCPQRMGSKNTPKECSQKFYQRLFQKIFPRNVPKNVPKECPKIMSTWQNLTHPNYIQKRMTNPRKGAPRPRACKFTV